MKLIFIRQTGGAQDPPVFYLKPDTALLRNNQPFFYPDYTQDVRAALSLVIRISRLGRSIGRSFAARYFDAVSLGIDLTAYDLLQQCKQNGWPEEYARSFDFSAPVGSDFIPAEQFRRHESQLRFSHNGQQITGDISPFIYLPEDMISYISQYITLKIGDYLFLHTGLTAGTLKIGDSLAASIDNQEVLRLTVQ